MKKDQGTVTINPEATLENLLKAIDKAWEENERAILESQFKAIEEEREKMKE